MKQDQFIIKKIKEALIKEAKLPSTTKRKAIYCQLTEKDGSGKTIKTQAVFGSHKDAARFLGIKSKTFDSYVHFGAKIEGKFWFKFDSKMYLDSVLAGMSEADKDELIKELL